MSTQYRVFVSQPAAAKNPPHVFINTFGLSLLKRDEDGQTFYATVDDFRGLEWHPYVSDERHFIEHTIRFTPEEWRAFIDEMGKVDA